MKILSNILVCVIAIFAVSSCDFFNDKKSRQEPNGSTTTVEGISQEIKNKIAAQDTLMNALVLKVDTLSQALTQAQKENAELKKRVTKLESPKSVWSFITLAVLAIAIVALILSLFILSKKIISQEEVDKIFSHNLDKSKRIAELKENDNRLRSELQQVKAELEESDVRLRKVETTILDLSSKLNKVLSVPPSTVTYSQEQSRQPKEPEYFKKGYANINSNEFFTEIFDSSQEGCVFSITFKSNDQGEFSIISLDKIKSRNGWQDVVDCTGCLIEDAKSFNVEEYGLCEKCDDVTWKVTKKLKIKLLK